MEEALELAGEGNPLRLSVVVTLADSALLEEDSPVELE